MSKNKSLFKNLIVMRVMGGLILGIGGLALSNNWQNIPELKAQILKSPYVDIRANGSNGPISIVSSDSVFRLSVGSGSTNAIESKSSKRFKPIRISWSSKGVKSCEVAGKNGTSGSFVVTKMTKDTVYIANCITEKGKTVNDQVKIYVSHLEIRANGQRGSITATRGSNVKISWISEHVKNCRIFTYRGKTGSFDFKVGGIDFRINGECQMEYGGYIYDDILIKHTKPVKK